MRLGLALVIAALLACKQSGGSASAGASTPAPAVRGLAPGDVLKLGKGDPKFFENRSIKVTGTVTHVEPKEDDRVRICAMGELAIQMHGYNCLRGFCWHDCPTVGTEATLKCRGIVVDGTPELVDCEP